MSKYQEDGRYNLQTGDSQIQAGHKGTGSSAMDGNKNMSCLRNMDVGERMMA